MLNGILTTGHYPDYFMQSTKVALKESGKPDYPTPKCTNLSPYLDVHDLRVAGGIGGHKAKLHGGGTRALTCPHEKTQAPLPTAGSSHASRSDWECVKRGQDDRPIATRCIRSRCTTANDELLVTKIRNQQSRLSDICVIQRRD